MPVTIDPAAIEELLYAPTGPVMLYAAATAEAIKDTAAALVHTSPEPHEDGSPHLADTGHVTVTRGEAVVTFDAPYAAAYHEGARPHVIEARNANVLAFEWPKKGPGIFFFSRVNHPGNQPHRFLLEAAELIAHAPLA